MKKFTAFIIMAIIVMSSLLAKPTFVISTNLGYSYDTNVFSSPLPQFDSSGEWLKWKNIHPFIKRHSVEFNLSFDTFIQDTDRIGISSYVSLKFPFTATSIKPVAEIENDFLGNWEYVTFDSTNEQRFSLFAGIGPIFQANFTYLNLGIAIRMSLGTYDFSRGDLILGMSVEPYFIVKITDMLLFDIKLTYDAHFMKFINSETQIYEPDYQMIPVAPSLGFGIKF